MKFGKYTSIASTAAVATALLGGPALAAEITLKLGTVANPKVSMGQAIVEVLMPKVTGIFWRQNGSRTALVRVYLRRTKMRRTGHAGPR